jgi:hypothetical protein
VKIKLFNGALTSLSLTLVSGGYDPETGRVTIIVRGEGDQAGTLAVDVAEANKLVGILTTGLPKVERVTGTKPTASDPLGQST